MYPNLTQNVASAGRFWGVAGLGLENRIARELLGAAGSPRDPTKGWGRLQPSPQRPGWEGDSAVQDGSHMVSALSWHPWVPPQHLQGCRAVIRSLGASCPQVWGHSTCADTPPRHIDCS